MLSEAYISVSSSRYQTMVHRSSLAKVNDVMQEDISSRKAFRVSHQTLCGATVLHLPMLTVAQLEHSRCEVSSVIIGREALKDTSRSDLIWD